MTRLRIGRGCSLWASFLAVPLFLATAAAAMAEEPTVLRGQVLLPDGKPAAGAELHWRHTDSPPPLRVKEFKQQKDGVCDWEGRFEIALSNNELAASGPAPCLVAHKQGSGIAWYTVEKDQLAAEIMLRLVEDCPVRGRIVDTEGRPIAGALLAVNTVLASRDGNIDPYLSAWKENWHLAWTKLHRAGGQRLQLDGGLIATTDRDGRFELSDIGLERLATVEIHAEGHAADALIVVNRPGFDAAAYNDITLASESPYARQEGLYTRLAGPELNYVAEPEVVVRGQIFTGAPRTPLKGAVVRSAGRGDHRGLSVTSDEQGHYEFRGLGRNRHHILHVPAPPGSDLLTRSATVAAAPGQAAIELDLELKRGVVVAGRMFDQTTGRGVRGSVSYAPLPANEFANQPGFDDVMRSDFVGGHTDEEGRFRFMIIPGPGVLLGHAGSNARADGPNINPYRQATFSEADRQRVLPSEGADDRYFATAGSRTKLLSGSNSAKVVDPREGSEAVACDLPLDPGKTIEVSIEDADGRPVRDAFVSGLAECGPLMSRIAQPTCTIYALGADRPRRVCILDPVGALAASLTLTGDDVGPVKVRLGAAATITGRALDPDGEPISGALVIINYARRSASDIETFLRLDHPAINSDDEGRFEVGNILPGERLVLDFKKENIYFRANLTDEQRQLKSGQKLELGDTKLKQLPIAATE